MTRCGTGMDLYDQVLDWYEQYGTGMTRYIVCTGMTRIGLVSPGMGLV